MMESSNLQASQVIHITPNQLLLPPQVYIGDVFTLRCTFMPSQVLDNSFSDAELSINNFLSQDELPFIQEAEKQDYIQPELISIKEMKLTKSNDGAFVLDISLSSWQTGSIRLSPYMLSQEPPVILDFQPFTVTSITQQNKIEEISAPVPPKMLPGTIYIVYFQLILMLVVILTGIFCLIKHKSIAFKIKNLKLLIKYRRNRKITVRELQKLPECGQDDVYVAGKIQQLMRNYLEQRFCYPFSRIVSSDIMKAWNDITQGILSDDKNEAAGQIASAFIRTDYIRYGNAKGLELSSFKKDEIPELVQQLVECIKILESREEDK